MSKPQVYYTPYAYGDSVFKGETWRAYRPGEDKRFPRNWVSYDEKGNLGSCLGARKDLVENARRLGVKLKWSKR